MRTQTAKGWQFFTATLLIVIGAINIIQALVALYTPGFYAATAADVLLMGYGAWSVLLGVGGVAMIVAGLTLLSNSAGARTVALVLAAASIIAQVAFVAALPVWSAVVIALSIVAIYGLTAGWPDRERPEDHEAVYRSGYRASHAAPQQAQSPEGATEPRQSTGPQQTSGQGY
ncbi:DUF7144 family membrane protein [Nocardiopsis halotolerans]|uniref:DUF7144 family membrane protein n=1 Tax=Nocardiopsis halotolerans TaxID=124252 RepID=UPI0003449A17|nr:hypothetical protein [Nocardiopsis halotolerans]